MMNYETLASPPRYKAMSIPQLRRWGYFIILAAFFATWLTYMTAADQWALFRNYWPMSLTMMLGSFVAGSTPQGGAAVAFPVFTKLLHIPTADSRTFGLMIQSIGMTFASTFIVTKGIKVLPRVISWVTVPATLGMVLGTYVIVIPNPYPRILFTLGAASFAVAMIVSRWALRCEPRDDLPGWGWRHGLLFGFIGVLGGILAAHTGSGVDLLTFIILTLAFGVDEKVSIPTTVIIMAINSVVGFFLHGVISQDIGIAWRYWLVSAPIVAVGAPLGVFVAARVKREVIIAFVLFLIAAELMTTILLIPFTGVMLLVTGLVVGVSACSFVGMLFYRQKQLAETTKSV